MTNAIAHAKVAEAIKKGKLLNPKSFDCADCGKKANEYDHRDYDKPLDVVPVCRSCNVKRGKASGRHDQIGDNPHAKEYQINIRVSEDQEEKMKMICEQRNMSLSEGVRQLIDRYQVRVK